MNVKGKHYRTVWMKDSSVFFIDQNHLPFDFKIHESKKYNDTCRAIKEMSIRGAGAIGAAAGFAMAQGFLSSAFRYKSKHESDHHHKYIDEVKQHINKTRPTAQNLFYATDRVYKAAIKAENHGKAAFIEAQKIADEDAEACRKIGEHGNKLIYKDSFNIETHCNAGWLAFVDYGTALSPIYAAHRDGKKVFVYVGETRPRNQGAKLTAWELENEGVPHTIMVDSAGAYLMSKKKVDMMIVGADRIAGNGDVVNKIGTLEKAIVAKEYGVPFYVAAPTSTIDLNCASGYDVLIEERDTDEVLYQKGFDNWHQKKVLVAAPKSTAINPGFDVTPSKYITGIITEKGIVKPNRDFIKELFLSE